MHEALHTISQKYEEIPTPEQAEGLLETYYFDFLYVDGQRVAVAETDLFSRFERASDGQFYLSLPNELGMPVQTLRVEDLLMRRTRKKIERKRAIIVKNNQPKWREGMVVERKLVEYGSRRWDYQEKVLHLSPSGRLHGYWSSAQKASYEEIMGFAHLLRVAELTDNPLNTDATDNRIH